MLSQQQLKYLKSTTFLDKHKIIKLAKKDHLENDINLAIQAANQHYQARVLSLPNKIHYPDNLPVAEKKQAIYDAIKNNQVVIIAGETGSGKTTQIPKICLELGLGIDRKSVV